jgi:predicted RNA-binding protein (virulence factor B family)
MNPEQQENLKRFLTDFLNADGAWQKVNEHYDRSWFVKIDQQDSKIILRLEVETNDSEVWTVADVALYTHQDKDKILRWCEVRARQQAQCYYT